MRVSALSLGLATAGLVLLGALGLGLHAAAEKAKDYAPVTVRTAPPIPVTPVEADRRASVVSVEVADGALTVAIEAVQFDGDLLFEPPVLRVDGVDIPPTADSLKAARLKLLEAIVAGRAQAPLVFADVPPGASDGALIFNPSSDAAKPVNPKVALTVTWGSGN